LGGALCLRLLSFSAAPAEREELWDGDECAGAAAGAKSSDSGTKRREMGSLFPGVVLSCRFWRERPAASPMERRVVREARRAASWSAWL
jgi:hypothetical protein